MPKAQEKKLKQVAKSKFGSADSARADRFVYGTMANQAKRRGLKDMSSIKGGK